MLHLFRRLRARVRNLRFDQELREELSVHEDMKRAELLAGGMSPDDARAAARRALGNVTLMREDARRVWIGPWLESVVQDLRYAVRSLVRQPLHSVTAATLLILAIGLNAALFTVFKAIALEPWPVSDPGRVVKITAQAEGRLVAPSVDEFRFIREQAKSFAGLVAHGANYPIDVRAPGTTEIPLRGSWATANFFDVLGVRFLYGSGFVGEDDAVGNPRGPVVLAYSAWRNYFGGEPAAVGRSVLVNGEPFTIVGVLDPTFDGNGMEVDVWMPLSALSTVRPSSGIAWEPSPASAQCCVRMVGRVAPGVDPRQAAEELQVLHEQFALGRGKKPGRVAVYGTAEISAPGRADRFASLGAFAGAVALVLVLACANVGNLQLARGLARRREIAARLSIGAGRPRLVRQFLTEGLVLAAGSGAVAVIIAATLPRIIFDRLGEEIPPYIEARLFPDLELLLFVLAVASVACVAFALAPALHATHVTIPLGMLDRSTRPGRFHLRSALLATQIAACTVLLTGAGLVTRAIQHALQFDPGFRDGVDAVSLAYPAGTSYKERQSLEHQVLEAAGRHDLVVALAQIAPLSETRLVISMALPNQPHTDFESVLSRPVSSRFFDVLAIPLVRGRTMSPEGTDEAVVNEAFVRRYWDGADPIGQPVRDTDRRGTVQRTYRIVGVVRDTYLTGIKRIDPVIFTPSRTGMFLTRGGPAATQRIRAVALGLNPAVAVTREPLTASLSRLLEHSRVAASFAWALSMLGLVLASVGVFGVFAYAVEERRREIGVRLALGAVGVHIVRMLLSTSGRAMIVGLALGLVLSLTGSPLLRSFLYGLSPFDPIAYGLVVTILAATAGLATLIPARRACRIDPAVTLREE